MENSEIKNGITEDSLKKRSVAMSLNAFVLPGVGHLYMGETIKGIFLIIATLFFFITPLVKYFILTLDTFKTLTQGSKKTAQLLDVLTYSWTETKQLMILCLLALAVIWGYSIYDIWARRERSNLEKN